MFGGFEDCGINLCADDWRKREKVDGADVSGEDDALCRKDE